MASSAVFARHSSARGLTTGPTEIVCCPQTSEIQLQVPVRVWWASSQTTKWKANKFLSPSLSKQHFQSSSPGRRSFGPWARMFGASSASAKLSRRPASQNTKPLVAVRQDVMQSAARTLQVSRSLRAPWTLDRLNCALWRPQVD